MAAPNINQILKVVAGQFSGIIHRKIINTGPWINLTNRDTWPDEMGDVISEMTYQRSLPDAKIAWSNYRSAATTGQSGTTCTIPKQTIAFNETVRQFGLQRAALESPHFCVDDLRFAFKRQAQLDAIQQILAENTKLAWEERNRDEYVRVCEKKVIVNAALTGFGAVATVPDFATDGSTGADLIGPSFPSDDATSILTSAVLDKVRMRIIREGGGLGATSMADGTPVFTLVCSAETSEGILLRNPELRADLRHAKPSELLAPLGVERSYKGYFHVIDDFIPRFTRDTVVVAGVTTHNYTMVRAWAKDGGGIWNINPDYETAPYEMSVVYHKQVCTSLIPKPLASPGGGTKFDPNSYTGQFKWVNILNEDTNPDGTIGYFRGIMASGTKAIRPEFGYAMIHLRCTPLTLIACDGTVTQS